MRGIQFENIGTLLREKCPSLNPSWKAKILLKWATAYSIVSCNFSYIYKLVKFKIHENGPRPLLKIFFYVREVDRAKSTDLMPKVYNIIKQNEWATTFEKCPKKLYVLDIIKLKDGPLYFEWWATT